MKTEHKEAKAIMARLVSLPPQQHKDMPKKSQESRASARKVALKPPQPKAQREG